MTITYVPWNPVGNYGCGDPYGCPTCSPHVQLERERAHQRKAASTYATLTQSEQVSEWLGEAHGTGGERYHPEHEAAPVLDALADAEAKAKAESKAGAEKVRVKRSLSAEQVEDVTRYLKAYPTRRCYYRRNAAGKLSRKEWLAEVWLELLNPTALVGKRESRYRGPAALIKKVQKAVDRAQHHMRMYEESTDRDRRGGLL